MVEIKKSVCLWCKGECGVLVHVENGRLVKVEEDPEWPRDVYPPTASCPRRRAATEYFYHPDRVNFPLKRVGERGEGKWERISWDQALDEIAEKLKEIKEEYGAEAVAGTLGTLRTHHEFKSRFFFLFGSPNLTGINQICWGPRTLIADATVGMFPHFSIKPETKCIILFGVEPLCSRPITGKVVLEAKERGAKLIVIDPRQTRSASLADMWLQLRPGTDCALILGMLNVIINENLYDKEFVQKWTNAPLLVRQDNMKLLREKDITNNGSDERFIVWDSESKLPRACVSHITWPCLNPAIHGTYDVTLNDKSKIICKTVWETFLERIKEYDLEKVSEITQVPKDKIKEASIMYAKNKPGTFIEGMGCEHLYNVAQALHARWILPALVGNIDVKGGEEQVGPPINMITSRELELEDMLPVEQKQKMIGANRFRVFGWDGNELIYKNVKRVWKKAPNTVYGQCNAHAPTLYRSIITGNPYPIKALLVSASNPMVTAPNTKLVYKALKSPNLDLIVVHDFFMTPSAELADYVLPAAGWLERADLWNFQNYSNYVFAKEAALPKTVPNKYEHYTDFDFYRDLGLRLGQEKYWPWNNLEDAFNYQIQPMGYDIKTLPRLLNWKINYKKYEENGFGTITGKVELYSTLFEKLGYDPLPYFEEPPESPISDPKMAAKYPLTLLTGARIYLYYHSEWRQIDSIRNIHPYPLVQIHPDTAKKLGIKEGEWVWIETPRGRVRQKAVLFKGMAPNIVQAEHGWWLPELPGEEPWLHGVWDVSINVLTDDDPDHCNPHIGSWQLRHTLCKVYKVKQY